MKRSPLQRLLGWKKIKFFQVNEGSQLLLSACLSCDGCLSDEDTLKISQQGLEEVERVLALNKVHFLWNQGVFLRCLLALAKQHLPLSLSEVWCVEAQGARGVGVSAVSAFLCCQVRCGHHWSGPQALRLPQAHRWFEFFSFMKYEVDFTISFLLSPFCFFLLLACFVILKKATSFFFGPTSHFSAKQT